MKHEAIYNLYPTVKHIIEDNDGNFVAKDENDNEVSIDMSAVETKAVELQQEAEEKEAKRKEDKLSAYRKMSMTDDEIREIDPTLLA
mgnify:CR=1 FL=1